MRDRLCYLPYRIEHEAVVEAICCRTCDERMTAGKAGCLPYFENGTGKTHRRLRHEGPGLASCDMSCGRIESAQPFLDRGPSHDAPALRLACSRNPAAYPYRTTPVGMAVLSTVRANLSTNAQADCKIGAVHTRTFQVLQLGTNR